MNIYSRYLSGRRDLLAPAVLFPERYPQLLESVVRGTAQARYDILFAFPQDLLQLSGDGRVRDGAGCEVSGRFLDALDAAWQAERQPRCEDDLPFHGGWALFLAYELAAEIEPSLELPEDTRLPRALALRCAAAMIVDHVRECTVLVAEREEWLDALAEDLSMAERAIDPPSAAPLSPRSIEEEDPSRFLDGVARIHEYLRRGDTCQVNLSRRWRVCYDEPPRPAKLYDTLRKANPAPFAALLQQPGWALISSSPERLIERRGHGVQTRPIAGTRPRLPGDDEAARIRELMVNVKERAEHVMLIDLERNDLGRICQPGTVEVDELMSVESYAHVHHIVSNVRGELCPEMTPGQMIAATFPGGTITGCPKVRCMQIIAELEGMARGPYTGAMGYLDRNGDLDLNILIRTLSQHGSEVCLRAGAGIVVDSDALRELDETRAKARGLLRALGVAAV